MKTKLLLLITFMVFINSYSQIVFETNFIAQGNFINQGDFDNDGDIDVLGYVYGDEELTLYENIDGQGNFEAVSTLSYYQLNTTAVADFNNDGFLDVVITTSGSSGSIVLYRYVDSQGIFEFQESLVGSSSGSIGDIVATDLDGDGDMDVVTSYTDSNDFSVQKLVWFENLDGLGNFSNQIDIVNIFVSKSIIAEDIDGDSDIDIITFEGNEKIKIFKNNGNENFNLSQTINYSGELLRNIIAKDLDSDNDLDLIISIQSSGQILWYENNGNGTFNNETIISDLTIAALSVDGADIDNDGDIDLVSFSSNGAPNYEKRVVWHENMDGQGSFDSDQLISIEDVSNTPQYMGIADVNNNGLADIIINGLYWIDNQAYESNQIRGYVKYDTDNNGCIAADIPITNLILKTENGSQVVSASTQTTGLYQLFVGEGVFETTIVGLPPYFTSNPITYSSNFLSYGNIDEADFCINSTSDTDDLNIVIYPLNDARPGFEATYQIVYRNVGTNVLSGDVSITYDDIKINFLNASETITSQTSNSLTFDYYDLLPFETRTIDITFNVFTPPTTEIGDVLSFTSTINPIAGDYTEEDNTFVLDQTVIGAYDPNDIQVLEGDEIFLSEADDYLHYIIRFQNVGTAEAINVSVENVLDANLDWNTLQIENISHSNRVEIRNGNQVSFVFDNINLPDSTTNEPESHGYIQYKIKPKNTVGLGDSMSNNANIFFDFNPAVATNIVTTTVVENLSIGDYTAFKSTIYPNPTTGVLHINSNTTVERIIIYNQLGQVVLEDANNEGISSINIENISQGIYFIKLLDANSNTAIKKLIKE